MLWEVEDVRTLLSSTTENRERIRIEGAEQFQLKKEKKRVPTESLKKKIVEVFIFSTIQETVQSLF